MHPDCLDNMGHNLKKACARRERAREKVRKLDQLSEAAPDLLEACQQALHEFKDPNRGPSGPKFTVDMLTAAIKAATE